METFLIKAAQFFLSISILVVLHELGHFIPAKLFKTKVEKFFLFFDVKFALFKKKIGDTVYGIGWLPLGGYVKIAGMIDESMDKEQMSKPAQPWEFRSKPTWQRLIIMLGGVIVNLLLGFVIYAMILFVWGEQQIRQQDIKEGYSVSPVMQSYGFKNGDIPLQVNDKPLANTLEINKYLLLRDVKTVKVRQANGTEVTLSVPDSIGSELFRTGEMMAFTPLSTNIIDSILPNSPAQKAGLQKGDRILRINDMTVSNRADVDTAKKAFPEGAILSIEVSQPNQKPRLLELTPKDGMMGIFFKPSDYTTYTQKYSLAGALSHGLSYGYWTLRDYIAQFKYVFTKKGASQVGGFAAIGNMFPPKWNWEVFWHTTAFISIMLAFMNILPIPALDGGHVMFLLYEMITGRKPSDKFLEYAQMVGFIILVSLLIYANGNDIYKAFFK